MEEKYEVLERNRDDIEKGIIRVRFPEEEAKKKRNLINDLFYLMHHLSILNDNVIVLYYCTMDDVQEMLKKDGKICLDYCYIKDFDYKQLYDPETEPKPELKDFSAWAAFFDGETDFHETTFSGRADFGYATFRGGADFRYATFSGDANFWAATFSGRAGFSHATFSGAADFGFATFSGKAYFFRATFSGDANFLHATFSDKADFNSATFRGAAGFLSATFNGETLFAGIQGAGRFSFEHCAFKDVTFFDGMSAKTLFFDYCTNHVLIDLQDESGKIEGLAFKNTNNLGHINLNWDYYKKALKKIEVAVTEKNEDGEEVIKGYKTVSDHCAGQYKMLKENYHNMGEYDWEDEAYVEFKRSERQQYERDLKGTLKKALSYVFDKVGRYGTDPVRVFVWMMIVIAVFSCIFSNLIPWIQIDVNDAKLTSSIIRSIYFSTVTFFTIGYGDIAPASNAAAILVCIEGFIGVFLMAFFSVSVVRKILR